MSSMRSLVRPEVVGHEGEDEGRGVMPASQGGHLNDASSQSVRYHRGVVGSRRRGDGST